jgi:hypothetical protein
MQTKLQQVSRYWGHAPPPFTHYAIDPKALRPFTGGHPAIMLAIVKTKMVKVVTKPLDHLCHRTILGWPPDRGPSDG